MYIAIAKNASCGKILCRNFFQLQRNVWVGQLTNREAAMVLESIVRSEHQISLYRVGAEIIELTKNNSNYLKKAIDLLSE